MEGKSLMIKVGNISNTQITSSNNKITTFKSNPISNDKVELSTKKKEISKGVKLGIIKTITAAIGLGIEVFACKGKHLKSIWNKIMGKRLNLKNLC